MTKTIKQRLQEEDLIMVFGAGRIMHHNLLQIVGIQGGFHGFWFDHEHIGFSMPELEVATVTARSLGMDNFVRIAPTDYALVTKCLEAGGGGVMAAQIHSAAQAEEFVKWSKFAPRGKRGLNVGGYDAGYASIPIKEFCEKSNRESLIAIQVETLGAVEECDAIAAIDGVDLLFVGPSDLSQILGITGEFMHEKCLAAIDRVSSACRNHGKAWGAVCANPSHAAMMVEKGCKMLSPTNDVKFLNIAMNAIKKEYAAYFEAF